MIFRRLTLVLLSALALAGCRRGAGKPDPRYEKARGLYQKLYAVELDDAYGDPKMDEVVALLKQVEPDSADTGAAQSMLEGIQHGREAFAAQKEKREKVSAALAAPAPFPTINPDQVLAASAGPDAGPAPDAFGPGAAIADINRSTGGCLVAGEPFTERGTNKAGTVYRLSSAPQCSQALPGFVHQVVLVVDGALYRRLDASLVPPQPPPVAAPAAVPDAGTAATATAAAPAKPAAAPAPPAAAPVDPAAAGQPEAPDAGP